MAQEDEVVTQAAATVLSGELSRGDNPPPTDASGKLLCMLHMNRSDHPFLQNNCVDGLHINLI